MVLQDHPPETKKEQVGVAYEQAGELMMLKARVKAWGKLKVLVSFWFWAWVLKLNALLALLQARLSPGELDYDGVSWVWKKFIVDDCKNIEDDCRCEMM